MPTCETCQDTHRMELRDREVPCTRCPTPCEKCRSRTPGFGPGAYCGTTPCACGCHVKATKPDAIPEPDDQPLLIPGWLVDAIRKYKATDWAKCDPSKIGAVNAVAYIGERVVDLVSACATADTLTEEQINTVRKATLGRPRKTAWHRTLIRDCDAALAGSHACREGVARVWNQMKGLTP